jgi:hypothetical protein
MRMMRGCGPLLHPLCLQLDWLLVVVVVVVVVWGSCLLLLLLLLLLLVVVSVAYRVKWQQQVQLGTVRNSSSLQQWVLHQLWQDQLLQDQHMPLHCSSSSSRQQHRSPQQQEVLWVAY